MSNALVISTNVDCLVNCLVVQSCAEPAGKRRSTLRGPPFAFYCSLSSQCFGNQAEEFRDPSSHDK
jgi:hypothetical protein